MGGLDFGNLPDEQRCTAMSKRTRERCKKARCTGLTVCETHGAATPSSRQVRNAAAIKRSLIRRGYGNTPVAPEHDAAHPVSGLAWELRNTAGNIEFLAKKLADMTDDQLIWGTTLLTVKRTLADELSDVLGSLDNEMPRISRNEDSHRTTVESAGFTMWVQLYLKERKHYVEILKLAISSGLENRRITILEEQVLQFNNVLGNIITRLGGDPEDPAVRALVRHELAALMPADALVGVGSA